MINKHLPHKTGCKLGCIIHNYLIINIYCGAGGSRSTDYHRIIARKDKKYLVPCQKEHT